MYQLTCLACLFSFPQRYAFSYIAGLCAFRRALRKDKNTAQPHVILHMTGHYQKINPTNRS